MRFKEFSKKLRENLEPHTKKPALPSKEEKEETVRQLNIARKNNNQAEIKRLSDKLLKLGGGSFSVNLDGDAIIENAAEPDEPKSDQPEKHSKHSSNLPSAASLDDEPGASEEDDEDEDEEDDDSDFADFLEIAGDMGDDLYSVTQWDYRDDFADATPNSEVAVVLNRYKDDPAVAHYLTYKMDRVTPQHMIGAVILNKRNGRFLSYMAGDKDNAFTPNLPRAVGDGIIDRDQIKRLREISDAGAAYREILQDVYWRSGTSPELRDGDDYDIADDVYSLRDNLVGALDLPSLPAPRSYKMDPEWAKSWREFDTKQEAEFPMKEYLAVVKRVRKDGHDPKNEPTPGELLDNVKWWRDHYARVDANPLGRDRR